MTRARKRIIGLLALTLLVGLLFYLWALAFLVITNVLTQHAMASGMSPWVSRLHRFVWFMLDRQALATHLAIAATMLSIVSLVSHRDLVSAVIRGFAALLATGLIIFAGLWVAYLHRVEMYYAAGELSPLWVLGAVNVVFMAAALVLCLASFTARFRPAPWLLLTAPPLLSIFVWLASRAWSDEYGYMLAGHPTARGVFFLGLPAAAMMASVALAILKRRSASPARSEASLWLAGLSAFTLTQCGFAWLMAPFIHGVSLGGHQPDERFNLLIHAVFVPLEITLVCWIWRDRGMLPQLAEVEEQRSGLPAA